MHAARRSCATIGRKKGHRLNHSGHTRGLPPKGATDVTALVGAAWCLWDGRSLAFAFSFVGGGGELEAGRPYFIASECTHASAYCDRERAAAETRRRFGSVTELTFEQFDPTRRAGLGTLIAATQNPPGARPASPEPKPLEQMNMSELQRRASAIAKSGDKSEAAIAEVRSVVREIEKRVDESVSGRGARRRVAQGSVR